MALVLASGSPRRRQLLQAAGVLPEDPHRDEAPVAFARRISHEKALAVAAPGHHVLAADTVVHLAGRIFGKPTDDEHAASMLAALSGRWHAVTTAWCLRACGPGTPAGPAGPALLLHSRTSRVWFRPLGPADIDRYLASGEHHDKAGAYAIQGQGVALVERVRGSYTNVIGLPLSAVLRDLARVGLLPAVDNPAVEKP